MQKSIDGGFFVLTVILALNEAIGDALLITAEKKVIFGLSYFFPSQFLVRHIFSESGLLDLNDHFGNLVWQIRHIKRAKGHFDLLCIPLFLNVASISVV